MTSIESSLIPQEVNKFALQAQTWWDRSGPLRTLHDINPARLQFIERSLNVSQKRVLDLGCGGGILSEAMAKLGAVVTGIDAEPLVIAAAKQHAKASKLKLDYHCSTIEAFETTESFDVITCMELLEHVHKPELILEHCKRLLKPEGFLFVSTINRTAKAYATAIIAAEYIFNLLPKQTHDYNKFIKPSELNAKALTFFLNRTDMSGMQYNPFTRQACLSDDVSVNYLMAFTA